MGKAVVVAELDPLRVHEDEAGLVRRGPHEDGGDHRVDAGRLARAGRPGDQEVRHLGEVHHHRAAGDVTSEGDLQGMRGTLRLERLQHAAERDELPVPVRHLDADRRAARDRGEDAHVGRRHGIGDVLRERGHAGHLHAGAELQLETGDRRPDREADEVGLDAVGAEGALEDAAPLLDRLAVQVLFLALLQELEGRQLPGTGRRPDRQAELFRLAGAGRGAEHVLAGMLPTGGCRICRSHASLVCSGLRALGAIDPGRAARPAAPIRDRCRAPPLRCCRARRRSRPHRSRHDRSPSPASASGRLHAHRRRPRRSAGSRSSGRRPKGAACGPDHGEQRHAEQPADRRQPDGAEHDGGPRDAHDLGEAPADRGSDDATGTAEDGARPPRWRASRRPDLPARRRPRAGAPERRGCRRGRDAPSRREG